MTILGTQPIWFEPFGELVVRWYQRQPEEIRSEAKSTAEAILRAEKRAARVLEFSGLTPMRKIKTAREWQTRWDAKGAWEILAAHLDKLGWDVLRARDLDDRRNQVARAALGEGERQSIVLLDPHLRQRAADANAAGCALELNEEDMAAIALAEELYEIESRRIGRPPREWVEELARPEFTRRLLGLPFHPLILTLVR